MEIEGLRVIISAEVKAAIENMRKVQDNISKLGATTKKETEKIVGFLTKWKVGWVGVGLAAIASLYGLAKSSAYMSMWFEEASGILGYFIDEGLAPLSPLIESIMNILWKFGDAFNALPEPIKAVVGVLVLLAAAIVPIITAIGLFGNAFMVGLAAVKGFAAAALESLTAFGSSILGAIAIGIGVGITAVWIMDKLGIINALDEAGRNLEKQIPTIFNLLKILTAPLGALGATVINIVRGQFNQILPDITRIFEDTMRSAFNISPRLFEAIYKIPSQMMPITKTDKKGFGGSWQTGTAFVPSTGLYTLHRGESVIPRGKSTSEGSNTINFNPTVNITGTTVNSAMDVRQLAAQLTSYWRDDLQRYSRLGVT